MFRKGSKIYSMIAGCCPKCHEESMYLDQNPYNLINVYKMHENCSHCGTKYKMEPSFFYGAMYVSYGLTVGIGVAAFIISKVIIGLELTQSFIAIIVSLVALMPITARLSRNIYINMFVSFNKEAAKK